MTMFRAILYATQVSVCKHVALWCEIMLCHPLTQGYNKKKKKSAGFITIEIYFLLMLNVGTYRSAVAVIQKKNTGSDNGRG